MKLPGIIPLLTLALLSARLVAQEENSDPQGQAPVEAKKAAEEKTPVQEKPPGKSSNVEDLQKKVTQKVSDVAEQINQDERARLASAGILKPIYELARYFSFSAFHWLAFALMATGVVSFALQLVVSKLILLARLRFSLTQVLVDLLGLVTSAVGLVLTTQAATENSKFTQSPAAVLSASAVGLIVGFIFFLWSHRQESIAARASGKR